MLHFCRLVNTAAMALRYLPEVQQHLAPPFPVWKHMRRNPFRKKKRQKKSIFIYGTTFKKNESGQDFQQSRSGTIAHKNKKRIMAVQYLPTDVARVALHGVTSHIFGNGISPVSDVLYRYFLVSITRCVRKTERVLFFVR